MNHNLPPGLFDVALKLRSHRAIIPAASQAAVYFAAGENKAPPLTQRNDFIHIYFRRHLQVSFKSVSLPALFAGVKGDKQRLMVQRPEPKEGLGGSGPPSELLSS